MSKALKTVGVIAGAVAVVATAGAALGLALGGTMVLTGVGSAAAIATVAGAVAGVASIGAQLTAKKPDSTAQGSITEVVIDPDAPAPYLMGETYFAGVLRHRVGYGPETNKVPNPYLWMVLVYSVAGPVQGLVQPLVDFEPIGSYYDGKLLIQSQSGHTPEAVALETPLGTAPGWNSTSKLSGNAAIGWNLFFDKDGKVFASGVPVLGAVWAGVRVYDPRADSTRPGGSGSQRVNDESTWAYSESPALHAATYAYGRYQNGVKVFGTGLPDEGIDWEGVAAWANDCDANNWTISGVIYEPGNRWENLKEICAAGGGQPVFSGGVLSFHWSRPRVALDVITEADIRGDVEFTAMQSYRNRLNTVIPKYRSPAHNWEMVPGAPIQSSVYLAEDGEERVEEWPFPLVNVDQQAGQLAAYKMVDAREFAPITLPVDIRFATYRPGDCLDIDLPQLGLGTSAVIMKREVDPASLVVTFTLMGETPSKHAYALGETAVPPPSPTIGQSAPDRDDQAYEGRAWTQVGDLPPEDVNDTIKPGGGVSNGKVSTGAIVENGVSVPWRVKTNSYINLPSGKTELLSMTVIKRLDNSDLEVTGQFPFSAADAIDLDVTYEVRQGGTLIDSRLFIVNLDANGNTKLPMAFEHPFDSLPAGTYEIYAYADRTTGNACSTGDGGGSDSGLRHMAAREYLR